MKRIFRVLGIPLFSYEEVLTESDMALLEIDNTGGEFEFVFQADEDEDDYDDEDYYDLPADEPIGFGFGGAR